MRILIKCIMLVIAAFSIVLLHTTFLLASELEKSMQLNSSEKLYIEKSFEQSKAPLDLDKENWGLSENESFSNSTLGDGVPFYVISRDFLNGKQGEDKALILEGYIFPIKVGEKPAGIAVYRYINGKLTQAELGDELTFEKEIMDGNNILKGNPDAKLIYDKNIIVFALAVHSEAGYDLLPILSTRFYGLHHYQLKPLAEITDELRHDYQSRKADPGQLYGGGATKGNTTLNEVAYYKMAGLAVIAISVGSFVLIRKRKNIV